MFTDLGQQLSSQVSQQNVANSPYTNKLAAYEAAVEMHEIGHSFRLGKADDSFLSYPYRYGEVYSGGRDDKTPERLTKGRRTVEAWSIMRRGWDYPLLFEIESSTYYAISIEEASTISNNNEQ